MGTWIIHHSQHSLIPVCFTNCSLSTWGHSLPLHGFSRHVCDSHQEYFSCHPSFNLLLMSAWITMLWAAKLNGEKYHVIGDACCRCRSGCRWYISYLFVILSVLFSFHCQPVLYLLNSKSRLATATELTLSPLGYPFGLSDTPELASSLVDPSEVEK